MGQKAAWNGTANIHGRSPMGKILRPPWICQDIAQLYLRRQAEIRLRVAREVWPEHEPLRGLALTSM